MRRLRLTLPLGSSSSIPTHEPAAKAVWPKKRTVPLPAVTVTLAPSGIAMLASMRASSRTEKRTPRVAFVFLALASSELDESAPNRYNTRRILTEHIAAQFQELKSYLREDRGSCVFPGRMRC